MNKPTKAILPVAGYGTRRLPIAKAIDKCMLPLLNRPIIDYVVQDVVKAGVTDVYFVVSDDAIQLRDYYNRDVELERYLAANGKQQYIPLITPPQGVNFHYIEQDLTDKRYGSTVPLWLAGRYIDPQESFYYLAGDDTLWRADGESEAAKLWDQVCADNTDGGLIGCQVPPADVSKYGVFRLDQRGCYVELVEKPQPEAAPSTLCNVSKYLFPGKIMEYVDQYMMQHRDTEYYITDVVNDFVAAGNTLTVRGTDAAYLDCGSLEKWVAANNYLLEHSPAAR